MGIGVVRSGPGGVIEGGRTAAARAGALGATTETTDADLVGRLARGDRPAFAELVRRWEGPVFRVAARVTGDLHEAEEVRQAVFLRLFRSPGSIRHPDRFAAWLRRATVNESIGAVRRRSRRAGALDRLRARPAAPEAPGPAEALASSDEAARLAEALARLSPEDRALLSLRFDEGLSFAEAAAALGRPVTTIKSRTTRLLDRLRALLGANDG